MEKSEVRVPYSLLLTRELTASAKVVWMAVRLDAHLERGYRLSLTQLADRTGLSRPTVRNALNQLKGVGLAPRREGEDGHSGTIIGAISKVTLEAVSRTAADMASPPASAGRFVTIPEDLVTYRPLKPQAKVLYGVLSTLSRGTDRGRKGRHGRFTYASLSQLTGLALKTVRRAVHELEGHGWLEVRQRNRRAPIRYTLINPLAERSAAEAAKATRRIDRAEYAGEAIMKEMLSLVVDSDHFEDNARPGFLVNPLSGERLELDRFYPPSVAFEFNGPQHYKVGGGYTEEQVKEQQVRDIIKAGICAMEGISLVVIHAEDLSLKILKEKIRNLLPLRDLRGKGPQIRLLESNAQAYRRAVKRS